MKAAYSAPGIFFAFVMALVVAMLAAAILSPWVQAALAPLAIFPLHRVFSRLTMLGVIVITAWLMLRHGLARREVLGYQRTLPAFLRHALVGLAAGIALMMVALTPLFLLDLRELNGRAPAALQGWALLALKGLGSGIAVALIEETFFRGALQGALQRLGAMRWALFAVPVLYSAVHFLGRATSVPYEAVNGLSGFVAWSGFFASYARPVSILDAFVALWCVGLLLAMVRRRYGDIAGCIGLHAGFVAAISLFRKVSSPAPAGEWSFLVGSFDGLLGIWIAAVTGLCCLLLWWRAPSRNATRLQPSRLP